MDLPTSDGAHWGGDDELLRTPAKQRMWAHGESGYCSCCDADVVAFTAEQVASMKDKDIKAHAKKHYGVGPLAMPPLDLPFSPTGPASTGPAGPAGYDAEQIADVLHAPMNLIKFLVLVSFSFQYFPLTLS